MTPISLAGYIFHDRNKWGRVIYVALFGIIICTYLKSLFPISLDISPKPTTFPSGHMFGTCTFYIWIAYEMKKKWLWIVTLMILCAEGSALVYNGYHNIGDVLGAVGFAAPFLVLYRFCTKIDLFVNKPHLLILPILPIAIILTLLMPTIKPHVIYALSALCLFAIAWSLLVKRS